MLGLSMEGFTEYVNDQDRGKIIDHTMWHTCVFADYVTHVVGDGEVFCEIVDHIRHNFRDPFDERKMYPNTLCSIMNHGGDVDAMPFSPPHDYLDEICEQFPHNERIKTYGMLQDLIQQFPHITKPIVCQ